MSSAREQRRGMLRGLLGFTLLGQPIAGALASAGRRSANVRSFGARGNGRIDDTTAFQRAIDSLARGGGVVRVPAGRYLIDPLRSVRMRSRVDLRMDPGAELMAKPNAAPRAYVLLAERVTDVAISGGSILGERYAHLGTKGEWGHGVMVRGASHVTLRNVTISHCWGDGISVGGFARKGEAGIPSSDILIDSVRCRGNRRQGLTIGRSRRVRVIDSEFSDTHGTKPEYGIDIEPDAPGTADDITIERCVLRGNRGGGIQAYHRSSNVSIRGCTIENNGSGIYTVDAVNGIIADNTIGMNRNAGVALRGRTRGFRVEANRFRGNNTRLKLPAAAKRASRAHVNVAEHIRDSNRVLANSFD
ncbi:right-handed parallel beta-helix repeat-containing protein [Lysobacter sp. Root494]|uniref:right-handed parallel beta-helix repeat-containing protein n=1 Tax=Lysobacter sp. Root494 TaxID=1736549 RepID=UPI00138F63D3|nr:right-handed parallel beta-helix repeat-containing protein [Lysobacter sp. Root494]